MKNMHFWMVAGLALGAILLGWSLKLVSIAEVYTSIRSASAPYLILTLAASVACTAAKAFRWKLLLQPIAKVTFSELQGPVYVGMAANLLITHAGELVRARLLNAGSHRIPSSTALASIGMERMLDLLSMLLIVTYLLIDAGGRVESKLASLANMAAVLTSVAAAVALSIVLRGESWLRLCTALTRRLSERHRAWLIAQLTAFVTGFRSIAQPALLAKALLASLVQWLIVAAALWFCAQAIGIAASPSLALTVLVFMVFGLSLPTAPGYLGTTQIAFIAAMSIHGIDESAAFSASVLYSAFLVAPQFLIGAGCFLTNTRAQPQTPGTRDLFGE